jgi:hypothetical protein
MQLELCREENLRAARCVVVIEVGQGWWLLVKDCFWFVSSATFILDIASPGIVQLTPGSRETFV